MFLTPKQCGKERYSEDHKRPSINVHPSTISRELLRNSGVRVHYNWKTARENARRNKRRAPGNRVTKQEVKDEAIRLLKEEQWSPKQISAVLKQQDTHVSHETTYKVIRKDKKDGGDLYKNCRQELSASAETPCETRWRTAVSHSQPHGHWQKTSGG